MAPPATYRPAFGHGTHCVAGLQKYSSSPQATHELAEDKLILATEAFRKPIASVAEAEAGTVERGLENGPNTADDAPVSSGAPLVYAEAVPPPSEGGVESAKL